MVLVFRASRLSWSTSGFGRSDAFTAAQTIARLHRRSQCQALLDRQEEGSLRSAKSDRIDVPVYARTSLVPHARFSGPAIVEQSDLTLLVPPGKSVHVDGYANLLISAAT